MRITKKLLTETITEVVGEEALDIVEYIKTRKNVSEFVIGEKTDAEIHFVRNILYKLHNLNLATYKRKKDSKKGYYISYWTFHPKRIKDVIVNLKKNKLEKLNERLAKEEKNKGSFFLCPNACARLDFEQSSEIEFKCPECGTLLQQQDNTRTIEFLKERIKALTA
jgi:transcription initiation factor TFIIE subunit alpha